MIGDPSKSPIIQFGGRFGGLRLIQTLESLQTRRTMRRVIHDAANKERRLQLVVRFSRAPNLPESRREAGFQPLPPDRIKSDFLGGWNGWKPSWASDSHAIESRIVRAICLATPFRRQPWAGTEAEFVQDLHLHFAPALSGLSVEGAADRQGWRRSSRDPLHAHL